MTARRRFKEWEVLATLILRGVVIPCLRCKAPIPVPTGPNQVQREHVHELALDGPDVPANCGYSHFDCHAIITNGTKATSAGSSKHRIFKAKRLAKLRAALAGSDVELAHAIKNVRRRAFAKGRKLQSRPFQKRVR